MEGSQYPSLYYIFTGSLEHVVALDHAFESVQGSSIWRRMLSLGHIYGLGWTASNTAGPRLASTVVLLQYRKPFSAPHNLQMNHNGIEYSISVPNAQRCYT